MYSYQEDKKHFLNNTTMMTQSKIGQVTMRGKVMKIRKMLLQGNQDDFIELELKNINEHIDDRLDMNGTTLLMTSVKLGNVNITEKLL